MFNQFVYFLLCIAWLASPAHSATLKVACATNFTAAMNTLITLYVKESGNEVICTFGSTGMLYSQITKGAPYDLFFAADQKRPAMLHAKGYGETPTLYAQGKVVVWSKSDKLISLPNWKEVIQSADCDRIGIGTPAIAPYGLKAEEAMRKTNILPQVSPKLVFGKSVGTAFQYAYSGAADASFVALSQARSEKGGDGRYWPIPEAQPVNQAACVLKNGDTILASEFLVWLKTASANTSIRQYGYE